VNKMKRIKAKVVYSPVESLVGDAVKPLTQKAVSLVVEPINSSMLFVVEDAIYDELVSVGRRITK